MTDQTDSGATVPNDAADAAGEAGGEAAQYAVVVNDEEQYSLWPADRDLPHGWYREGTVGSEEECLAHIETVWTDMRPASLRRQMAAADGGAAH